MYTKSAILLGIASATTLIGAGILGLPVVVFNKKPWLFFAVYFVAILGQFGLILFTVQVLHTTDKVLAANEKRKTTTSAGLTSENISLGSISVLFLSRKVHIVFLLSTFFLYITMLVCFGLGGTQAVASVIVGETHIQIVISYFFIAMFSIYVFGNSMQYILTILPYFESMILIAALCLIWGLPESMRNFSFFDYDITSSNRPPFVIDPFLMASATISGLPSTICVLYKWIPKPSRAKSSQRLFFITLVFALLFSTALNILWALSVFEVSKLQS